MCGNREKKRNIRSCGDRGPMKTTPPVKCPFTAGPWEFSIKNPFFVLGFLVFSFVTTLPCGALSFEGKSKASSLGADGQGPSRNTSNQTPPHQEEFDQEHRSVNEITPQTDLQFHPEHSVSLDTPPSTATPSLRHSQKSESSPQADTRHRHPHHSHIPLFQPLEPFVPPSSLHNDVPPPKTASFNGSIFLPDYRSSQVAVSARGQVLREGRHPLTDFIAAVPSSTLRKP